MTTIPEAFNIALNLHQTGRFVDAENIYRQILEVVPQHADSLHLLGVIACQSGKHATGIELMERAILANPSVATMHCNLGNAYRELKSLDLAEQCYRRAVLLEADHVEAHCNLGIIYSQIGKFAAATNCFRRALELNPNYVDAYTNLGFAWRSQGNWDESIACLRRALELQPQVAATYNHLGSALSGSGNLDEAIINFRRAIELSPNYADAYYNLGNALSDQRNASAAVASYQKAIELNPAHVAALTNLGGLLQSLGKPEEAVACFRRVLEIQPNDPVAYNNLGIVLYEVGKSDDAIAAYRRSVQLQPDYFEAHNNLGTALKAQGMLDEAIACFQRTLELKPNDAKVFSNLLLTLQYRPDIDLKTLADAHVQYDERFGKTLRSSWKPHTTVRDPERPLRIGFVSADFCRHPVGYFLIRALENLRPSECTTYCYNDRTTADSLTHRFQKAANFWHEVCGTTDEQLADLIRADQIDILFDLAGHMSANRLLVFARKPAPLQISWAGYVGTTGLAAMDYLLADKYEVPSELECYYRERILRMPDGYITYDPPNAAPLVAPLPALTHGFVTYGSFNYTAKITPQVVDNWAKILLSVPNSRLILKYRGMNDPAFSRRLLLQFLAHGIDEKRVEFLGFSSSVDHLTQYNRVDIALDTYPYGGGLTTCEALWMGVPVVTCPGPTFASRHSLSHLTNVGQTDTIADNLGQYVEIAVGLAQNLPQLAQRRSELRDRFARSPLCDGKRFADSLCKLIRTAWHNWCRSPVT